jgi:hypothetical protein
MIVLHSLGESLRWRFSIQADIIPDPGELKYPKSANFGAASIVPDWCLIRALAAREEPDQASRAQNSTRVRSAGGVLWAASRLGHAGSAP